MPVKRGMTYLVLVIKDAELKAEAKLIHMLQR